MLSDAMYRVLTGLVLEFTEGDSGRSTLHFPKAAIEVNDPVDWPEGKVVRVTFEYVDEKECKP